METVEKILHVSPVSRYQQSQSKNKGPRWWVGTSYSVVWPRHLYSGDNAVFNLTYSLRTNLVLSNQIHQFPLIFNQHVCFLWSLHLYSVINYLLITFFSFCSFSTLFLLRWLLYFCGPLIYLLILFLFYGLNGQLLSVLLFPYCHVCRSWKYCFNCVLY